METNPVRISQKISLCVAVSLALMFLVISPQTARAQQWTSAPPNIYYNGGNVGIDTASNLLGSKLEVYQSYDGLLDATVYNDNSGVNAAARLLVHNGASVLAMEKYGTSYSGSGVRSANFSGLVDSGGGINLGAFSGSGILGFYTGGLASTNERMRITSNGNVGIGTATPGSMYKLDVAGNINSSATITGNNIVAKYQDVAEWVPSTASLPAATAVVLDSTKSNQVIASKESDDIH